jgi:uncharacterized membrane protein
MSERILKLVQLSFLTAILIVMSLTPLGYLKIGIISITLLMIPVVIGAIVCGAGGGAFLGFVMGITSLLQCITGADALGALLWAENPLGTIFMTVPTRILAGLLPGLLFAALFKTKFPKMILYSGTALIGSLLNTILFLGVLLLIFGNNETVIEVFNFSGGSIVLYILKTIAATNGMIEAVACTIVGASLSAIIDRFLKTNRK